MVAAPRTTTSTSLATKTVRNAGRSSTAPARSSWIWVLTAPAWAKSPAPPASPRARCTSISPTRTGCSKPLSRRKRSTRSKLAFNFDPGRDVPTTLREFGQAYIQLLCRPGGGSAIRTVMAIAERMPEVGRRYYENVLEKTIDRLAGYLEVHVRARSLRFDDCQLAASQFMQMCQASLFLPFIFQAAPAAFGRAHRARWSKARRGCFWRRTRRRRAERRRRR